MDRVTYEIRRAGGNSGAWWVQGLPCGPVGPYGTKQEALDDARGLVRFYREQSRGDGLNGQKRLFDSRGAAGQLDLF